MVYLTGAESWLYSTSLLEWFSRYVYGFTDDVRGDISLSQSCDILKDGWGEAVSNNLSGVKIEYQTVAGNRLRMP